MSTNSHPYSWRKAQSPSEARYSTRNSALMRGHCSAVTLTRSHSSALLQAAWNQPRLPKSVERRRADPRTAHPAVLHAQLRHRGGGGVPESRSAAHRRFRRRVFYRATLGREGVRGVRRRAGSIELRAREAARVGPPRAPRGRSACGTTHRVASRSSSSPARCSVPNPVAEDETIWFVSAWTRTTTYT